MSDDDRTLRIDVFAAATVDEPFDCGWGVGILHADDTVTRTCKGCGATVTEQIRREAGTMYARGGLTPVQHERWCPVMAEMLRRFDPTTRES